MLQTDTDDGITATCCYFGLLHALNQSQRLNQMQVIMFVNSSWNNAPGHPSTGQPAVLITGNKSVVL